MITVRFRRHAPPYAAGEVAGFPEKEAIRLRNAGAVVFLNSDEGRPHIAEEEGQSDPATEPTEAADPVAEVGGPVSDADPATEPTEAARASGPHGNRARSARVAR
ncbi:hypothetical protein J2850_005267 [Azospirillum picis]|uniref:Mu-like prophage FluMu N-terminal domain-containing protein n=1 Tax=Azospirillum picis TaxID=488438 RepID=A0ABU0MRY8_9PROT|nr:hypothetical protein [Azospirillum picis]MDQ0536230.1 hypothetical protein [Azospirillum picis]